MFVITADQVASRREADRAGALVDELAARYADDLVLPADQTAGDEIQLVTRSAPTALAIVLDATRTGRWSVGVGVGDIRMPLPDAARKATGSAFIAAREAVTAAKRADGRFALRAAGPDGRAPPPTSRRCPAARAAARTPHRPRLGGRRAHARRPPAEGGGGAPRRERRRGQRAAQGGDVASRGRRPTRARAAARRTRGRIRAHRPGVIARATESRYTARSHGRRAEARKEPREPRRRRRCDLLDGTAAVPDGRDLHLGARVPQAARGLHLVRGGHPRHRPDGGRHDLRACRVRPRAARDGPRLRRGGVRREPSRREGARPRHGRRRTRPAWRHRRDRAAVGRRAPAGRGHRGAARGAARRPHDRRARARRHGRHDHRGIPRGPRHRRGREGRRAVHRARGPRGARAVHHRHVREPDLGVRGCARSCTSPCASRPTWRGAGTARHPDPPGSRTATGTPLPRRRR